MPSPTEGFAKAVEADESHLLVEVLIGIPTVSPALLLMLLHLSASD